MMVDIIIVNWNSGLFLRNCVSSILSNGNEKYVQSIIIIDNNSNDGSANNLPTSEKLKLISNNKNKGFAQAANQGFKLSDSAYCLLLNPDARLLEDTLLDCLNFMKGNTNIDIMGCRLLNDEGTVTTSCARFPTPMRFLTDALGLSKIAPSVFTPALLMTDWNHADSRTVDQVMGAFMFMPTKIFNEFGYFDERFFVYYEELDYSKRVTEAGGTIFYNAEITALHSGEGTTKNVKAFRTFLNLSSRLKYAEKHFSKNGYRMVWFSTCIIEPFTRAVLLLVQGKIKEIPELIKAYKMIWKNR